MSGIYINGKELPENCDSCFCYYNPPDSWEKLCSVSQREWYMSDKKPDWCPLIPVPDHGRLGDLDALKKNAYPSPCVIGTEFHVGCGAFAIYAGTLNSRNKNLWQNKSEVTDEAVSAVAQYLLQENKSMVFQYKGKKHRLCVVEV